MSTAGMLDRRFFHRYAESDVFTRSFAKFLFFLCIFFMTLMIALFFVNLKKLGFWASFATSGTSCMSASITMLLIVKGRPRLAGSLFAYFQASIVILGGVMRTPEISLVTVVLFAFPTLLLATIFTYRWVHISIMLLLCGALILNIFRFDVTQVVTSPEIVQDFFKRGTIIAFATFILLYSVAIVAIRSLRLALSISEEETRKSNEKNKYIMQLLATIRNSYNELTESIGVTGQAVSNIHNNMQTEASTIEQLVASIEEISSSTTSVEQATRDQNSSVNELGESISSLSQLIDSLQLFGSELQTEFLAIARMSTEGKASSSELNEVNRKTLANSENMQTIAGIIDDFFEKINLLSLNAAIEAARAGEHGRGFAVVADEVGKLADISSSELKKIKDLIEQGRSDVVFSNSIIDKIINFIESLSGSLNNLQTKAVETMKIISGQKNIQGEMIIRNRSVYEKSEFIKDASAEQAVSIHEIAKSIENTNALVQENTGSANSLRESYERIKRIAGELKQIMDEKE